MRIFEREVDFLAEGAWFQWGECSSDSMVNIIKSIAYEDMDLNDFNNWFEEMSESKRIQLLVVFTVYEHNGWVYLVDNKKFK